MCQIIKFGVVLFLIGAHPLRAANPDDIEFRARLVKNTLTYHMGESIEVEISYSSQTEKKYYGSFVSPTPQNQSIIPRLSPLTGVLDLRELRRDRGMAGSFLGSEGYVGRQPNTERLELCDWYRFQKPGYYSVTITSTEISRVKRAEEGGGVEGITLESNPVGFEILPVDAAWDAAEASNLVQDVNTATNVGERGEALRRLARLDTPASVKALVHFYLTNTNSGEGWIFDGGFHDSSHIDIIIRLLTAALSDPTVIIPQDLTQLLADLETRNELGVMPAYPSDPAGQQKWTEEWKARAKVHDKYVAEANSVLTASIGRRAGPERATAIFQAWYEAVQLNAATPEPEVLSRLQSDVLAIADDLDVPRRVQFVTTAWRILPHEQLRPIIQQLAKGNFNDPGGYYKCEVYQLWHEGWPDECDAAILHDVIDTNAKMDKNVILMMSEAEHPELDEMLAAQLRDPSMLYDAFQSQRMGAAVLRAGSSNIIATVDSFLDHSFGKQRCDGETQGDLIGYLFRVAPQDAANHLTTELQGRGDSCASQVLRTLHSVRPSDDIIPIVIKALDSPNSAVAQFAALYLADKGPASAADALWQRLEALRTTWQGKSSELSEVMMPGGSDFGAQTAMLECALVSSLMNAKNWKLSPAELDHLRSGCLTQRCREFANGKISMGF